MKLSPSRPSVDSPATDTIKGGFKTAAAKDTDQEVTFTVVTCGDYIRRDNKEMGHEIYDTMLKLNPDFFVHTGDIEYYDKPVVCYEWV